MLPMVSKLATAVLEAPRRELDATSRWIAEGAGHQAKDFQVAPCSAGAPEVVSPFPAVPGLLNDRYFG